MSIKFSDAQLVMLSAASQRDDRCLEPSNGLNGAASRNFAEKLISAGLAREIMAKAGRPIWRRDDEAGRAYALKLTAAGLGAIAVDDGEEQSGSSIAEESASPLVVAVAEIATTSASTSASASPEGDSIATAPRTGSKIARVISLLQRDQGATLQEIVAATDWLPHTSRAAITGLRKRGYAIERQSRGDGGKSYVLAASTHRSAA